MRLRCEMAVPAGLRRARTLVRLEPDGPDALVLLPAKNLADATHQLVDAAGVPLLTHLSDKDPGVAAEVNRAGYWELPETLAVLLALRPGMRVVDAGAQAGYYSVLAARSVRAKGRVYAVDPGPDHRVVLAANAALSAMLSPEAASIEVLPLALTDQPGNARLYLSDRNPGDHTTASNGQDAIATRVVPAATLDGLRWPSDGPTVIDGPVGLLKIDIPGGEAAALRGAERVLATDRPVVAATLRMAATGPEPGIALVEWLASRGYPAFRFLGPAAGEPYPLLTDMVRVLAPAEAADLLRKKLVSPQVALLAYPDS